MRWSENDDLFRKELTEGHVWAACVAERLRTNGLDVQLTPLVFRNDISEADQYTAKEKDILVGDWPLEVKSRRLTFEDSPDSYPYSTAFVDTVDGWDRKEHQPVAVVLVSQETQGMLVVSAKTRPFWTVRTVRDRVRNIPVTNYECPKDCLLPFDSLVTWLKEHK